MKTKKEIKQWLVVQSKAYARGGLTKYQRSELEKFPEWNTRWSKLSALSQAEINVWLDK